MLAEKDPIVEKTVNSVYSITQDKIMREKMEAREEFLKVERTNKWIMEQQEKALAEKDKALVAAKAEIADKDAEIAELKAKLERMDQK